MIPSPLETRASLIVRLRDAADVAAWDEFVAIYGPLVYRLALRQGLQAADTDDVVQQVFAAVAQSVHQWLERPQRGRFRSWLLMIARNIAIKTLMRRPTGGVGRGGDPGLESLHELAAPDGDVSSQFDLEYRREVYRWAAERPEEIRDNAASAQTETVSLATEPELQWESDANGLESLRQDFAPIELKTKKLWDIEPPSQ